MMSPPASDSPEICRAAEPPQTPREKALMAELDKKEDQACLSQTHRLN
jgi:hypothetical protein